MFSQLVESRPDRKRGRSGAVMSFLAHYGLILGVLYTSAEASNVNERRRDEAVTFVEPPKVEPQPKQPSPELTVAPPPLRPAPSFAAPIDIPNTLPEIDLTRAQTDPLAFESRRRPGSYPAADSGTSHSPPANRDYLDFQVDKPVVQAPNSVMPAYPDMLRQAGIEGEALVSFVVDTLGRVDLGTFKVIRSTHDLFATAVKNALPRMRFIPAETNSGKVRQLVQQPFSFAIVK